MADKLTLIKITDPDYVPDHEELKKINERVLLNDYSEVNRLRDQDKLNYWVINTIRSKHYLTIVRIGDDNHPPTRNDLEEWKKIFDQIKYDPHAVIITHKAVTIECIEVGNIVDIE